jgi:hypothetical protein
MNPAAILALISDLYAQLTAAQERVSALEAELAARDQSAKSSGGTGGPIGAVKAD